MTRKFLPLVVLCIAITFVQCKREPLSTSPKVTNLSDFQSGDGEICLSVKGGKAPYDFKWSNTSKDSIISSLSAGVYTVTVTDAKGVELIDTIEVTQPQWPVCIDKQGNSYKTIIIGDQTWMIENLRSALSSGGDSVPSLVYGNDASVEKEYGRLYTWSAAMNNSVEEGAQGICPDGWHIPTDKEWSILVENISNSDEQIPDIKNSLELQYAGFYNLQFQNIDMSVSFWTSTKARNNAWKRYFNKNLSKAFRYHENKNNAISVRCIKNQLPS